MASMQLGRFFMVFQLRSAASLELGCYLFIVVGGSVGSGGLFQGGDKKSTAKKNGERGKMNKKFLGHDLGDR